MVHSSPSASQIPSPQLVAAWFVLNTLPTEKCPLWAAHWLTQGYDGPALIDLAGLHGDDPHDVRDVLPQALIECGVSQDVLFDGSTTRRRAAAMIAFNHIASLRVQGLASQRWVSRTVQEVIEQQEYEIGVIELPLGSLNGLEDEWVGQWGRSETELRAAVDQACRDQLEPTTPPQGDR